MKAVLTGPHAVRRTLGPGWGGRVSVLTDPVAALVVTAVVPHLDSRGRWRVVGELEELPASAVERAFRLVAKAIDEGLRKQQGSHRAVILTLAVTPLVDALFTPHPDETMAAKLAKSLCQYCNFPERTQTVIYLAPPSDGWCRWKSGVTDARFQEEARKF